MAAAEIKWDDDPLYFIFHEAVPGKTKMHTHALDLKDWVKIDQSYMGQMKLRRELWQKPENRELIYVSNTDESAEACKWELFETLVDHLPKRFPDIFEIRGTTIYNKALDESISTDKNSPICPLQRAGMLTQDDWCIIEWNDKEEGYVLTSGVVYFPMRWSLQDKFNKGIGAIHGPVKAFTKHLQPKVYEIFKKMKPEKPLWRANWAVFNDLESPLDLYSPLGHEVRNEVNKTTTFEGDKTGKELLFRAEYQTLRKLPKTKCIIFGIRTYQRHLEEFKNYPESDCEGLIQAIETLDTDMNLYKGADFWKTAAVEYLQYAIKCHESNELDSLKNKWVLPVGIAMSVAAVGFAVYRYRSG